MPDDADLGPMPMVLEPPDDAFDVRLGYEIRWSRYQMLGYCHAPGEYPHSTWALLDESGRTVAEGWSYAAITAASRLLNGWCE